MKIDSRETTDVVILKPLEKTIDFANGIEFKEHIYDLLKEGKEKIVVNMDNVSYIDSAGLGSIIAAAGQASKGNGKIVYSTLSTDVSNLFKMNNLGKYLSVFETEEEAIESFL